MKKVFLEILQNSQENTCAKILEISKNSFFYRTPLVAASVTLNDFIVNDSFDAAKKIQKIPRELFDSGYKFVSNDVISLFTNLPLAKTIDIILKRVYSENLVTTNLIK